MGVNVLLRTVCNLFYESTPECSHRINQKCKCKFLSSLQLTTMKKRTTRKRRYEVEEEEEESTLHPTLQEIEGKEDCVDDSRQMESR